MGKAEIRRKKARVFRWSIGETGENRKTLQDGLCAEDALGAVRFGAGVGESVALAVEADDEHRASVAIAAGLFGSQYGRLVATRRDVADTLAEAAMAELVGAAEEVDAAVGVIGSEQRLHGAKVLVAQG